MNFVMRTPLDKKLVKSNNPQKINLLHVINNIKHPQNRTPTVVYKRIADPIQTKLSDKFNQVKPILILIDKLIRKQDVTHLTNDNINFRRDLTNLKKQIIDSTDITNHTEFLDNVKKALIEHPY